MRNRDLLVSAVRERVARAQAEGDARCLMTEQAVRDAADLAGLVLREPDLAASTAVAWFHWERARALPRAAGREDLDRAAEFFEPLYRAEKSALPDLMRQAFAETEDDPDEDYGLASEYNSRAGELMSSYQRGDGVAALDEAIALWRKALAATTPGFTEHARAAANLANGLLARYENAGTRADLEEAVQLGRVAADAVFADAAARAVMLAVLAAGLTRQAQLTGDAGLMRTAVERCRAALSASVAGESDEVPYHRANLAYVLCALFDMAGGDAVLLEEAVECGRLAVRHTDRDHPHRAHFLTALGGAMQRLGQERGDQALMREAQALYEIALQGAGAAHPRYAEWQSDLASIHLRLFGSTGDSGSLVRAASSARAAAGSGALARRNRSRYLANLSVILLQAFLRTGAMQLLNEATLTGAAALRAASRTDPIRPLVLSNLGVIWLSVHEHPAAPARQLSLRLAVHNLRSAVAITPDGHPYRARHLHNLSFALHALYLRSGKQRQLAEAVACARAAAAEIPADHPDLAACQFHLGSLLQELARRTGRAEPAGEAYRLDCAAAANPAAPTMTRITASRRAAAHAAAHGMNERALELCAAGIDLAQRLAPRSLARPDREHLLEQLAGVAAEAAAAAVSAGQPGRAVELLEQSRGLLVADVLDARVSELTRLRGAQPELAHSLEAVMDGFADLDRRQASARRPLLTDFAADREADGAGLPQGDGSLAADRQATQQAWDGLVGRIRATDGFAEFLRAPRIADLAAQAADGPVVFVYAADTRCDALIVRHGTGPAVQVVPMPGLTRDDVLAQVERVVNMRAAIAEAGPAGRRLADQDLQQILGWTWDWIAAPVLAALGHGSAPTGETGWPRIWWCPVGSVACLPLHAAGHHLASDRNDRPRAVIDLAVSSYTPTLRGLGYARTHQPADPAPGAMPKSALIVAAPDIAGLQALPGARRETSAVSSLLCGADILAEPTKAGVLRALPGYPIAHFACHAVADLADPAASHLVLADQESASLTVAEIGTLALNARLAYLSACETTSITLGLADEAVHVTGAFQLAGYQHVIGTAWPVSDGAASQMAKSFYTRLTNSGAAPADAGASALALHHSVRAARAIWAKFPTRWAPYTHTGI